MNINNIINHLANTDTAALEQPEQRRFMLKTFGAKLAVAAVPFAIGGLFTNKAYGQSKETIINVLNYLLKLEFIKQQLYAEAAKTDKFFPDEFKAQFDQMASHNKSHIEILQNIVKDLGGNVVTLDTAKIDLTGGSGSKSGPFGKALTNFENYLVLMQFFSDGGVRIYKGQITEVLSDKTTVQALMNIHSVIARQATFIRALRNYYYGGDVRPWITNTNSDTDNPSAQRAYSGDGIITQSGIDIVGINGFNINSNTATQAFDEPLIMLDGNNILDRFIDNT